MAIVNITAQNDADFRRAFIYQTVDEVPIDITGSALTMMLRRHASDAAALLELTTGNGALAIIGAGAPGKFSLAVTKLQLMQLGDGVYDHSLVMTKDGAITAIWRGTFTVLDGASR
jgi:hypothetical protein